MKIGSRRLEDVMRKWEVILSRALSLGISLVKLKERRPCLEGFQGGVCNFSRSYMVHDGVCGETDHGICEEEPFVVEGAWPDGAQFC